MKHAVIDLGSNTVRMSVYDLADDSFRLILSKKELVGLIGYSEKGMLSSEGMVRVTAAMKEMKETASAVGIESLRCFATAGVRSIKNAEELLEKVLQETGIAIQVISGEEESRLDFLGAWHPQGISEGLVMDMGGGSTEIVRYKNMKIENAVSLSFGSLSLYRRFVSKILPNKEERNELSEFIQKQLSPIEWLADSAEHIILIGGTARAVARLHQHFHKTEEQNLQGYAFPAEDIVKLLQYFKENKKDFIRSTLKVAPERIHTVLPGLMTFYEILELTGCKTISLSRTGVREGYLQQYATQGAFNKQETE